MERSKFIPVRLELPERKYLRLLESACNVSEYTDKVDIISYTDKAKRIYGQLKDICAVLSGLLLAHDYKSGQQMIKGKEFKEFAPYFQHVFELGRRHKIRNPEKMRTSYGKLLYLLMDSQIPEIQEMLEFTLVKPVHTVHNVLTEKEVLAVLRDPLVNTATKEIYTEGKTRPQIEAEKKGKERALDTLARKYATAAAPVETIRQCLLAIGDNHNYLRMNRDPVDKMITFLTTFYSPDEPKENHDLSISGGRGGARLTHSHKQQYYYVLQSLMLWREILHDMFRLWYLTEEDLLSPTNSYRLTDTGQGLNRVQSAPRIRSAMSNILHRVQQKVGFWVGSSVVHLGDRNVPNAFNFIDKYTQVPRILNPIVTTINKIDELATKPGMHRYLNDAFGGAVGCKLAILTDFFRHAFDGSGADNFFDAGSCIDGRLTSAWNWCNTIDKKPYYHVFLLTGFTSFDGDWQA